MSAALNDAAESAMSWLADTHKAGTRRTSHLETAEAAERLANWPDLDGASDVFVCLIATCVERGWALSDLALAVQERVNSGRAQDRQMDGADD